MWLLSLLLIAHLSPMPADHLCAVPGGRRGACEPGDIIIGGLFPVHQQVRLTHDTKQPPSVKCAGYDVRMFLRTQVMIYSLGVINKSPILPNLTLGYEMYDTCGDVTMAVKATLRLMEDRSHHAQECSSLMSEYDASARVAKAVVGDRYSESSIATSRLLALPLIPQISYASTSELLSRKFKFPSFLRTVPSDVHQTKAIAKLAKRLNWKSVGAIGSDDEYGKYGVESLIDHLSDDVCLDFKEILPADFSLNAQTRLNRLMETINDSTAEGIVIFTKTCNVRIILEEVIRLGVNRTWIASDTWSTASEIYGLEGIQRIGKVYGFIMNRNKVPGFKEHVQSFTAYQEASNIFFHDYLSRYPACPNSSDITSTGQDAQNCSFYDTVEDSGAVYCINIQCLVMYIDHDESYSIYLAVNVIAQALHSLLKCDNAKCERNATFFAWELLEEIKQGNFTIDNITNIKFDQNGDPSIGYDIMGWEMEDGNVVIKPIGEYRPSGYISLPEDLVSESSKVTVTVYNCSKACPRGQELNSNENTCCKTCNFCVRNQFSKGGRERCTSCKDREYVTDARDGCRKKAVTYLDWTDGFAIVLALFGAAGLIFTLLVAALFMWHRHTPIVKGTGGNLCFLILLSLFASFGSLSTFIGEPTDVSCKVGLPFFVISFALCVSCILANLLQISVGFAFNAKVRDRLKRLNEPVAIVMVCTAVQVTLCALWLTLAPPTRQENLAFRPREVLIRCHNGSDAMFGTTLGYIALLAVVCFVFGFKGKQLPDLYKNSSFITISMLIYLVVWILFIPVYINTSGKYVQAIEACAILVSDYSILFCHFCPKCYIMLLRKELNDEKAILDYIQKHYERKGVSALTANR